VDKFADFADCKRAQNGTMIITKGTNAFISATYTYYHQNIKPKPQKAQKAPEGQHVWRCKICGYEYVGESLPDDYICICPICKHPASDFEQIS